MSTKNRFPFGIIAITGFALLVGCGGASDRSVAEVASESSPSGDSGSSSGGSFDDNTDIDDSENLAPALTFSYSVTGSGGKRPSYTSPEITTDSILKVRVFAESGGRVTIPGYRNFSVHAGCVSFEVHVNGQSRRTTTLAVPGADNTNCPNAPESQLMDFSTRVSRAVSAPVTVKIKRPQYDVYCQWYQENFFFNAHSMESLYCPMRNAFQNHSVPGRVEVQVNGTESI